MLFQYLAPTSNVLHPKILIQKLAIIRLLLFLWMLFFSRVAHRFEKNQLLNTSAIKCSMNTHLLREILKKNITVLLLQVTTVLNRKAAKNKAL